MSPELKKAYWQLHVAVFIFGFTAILGKMITTDHFTLVWHRMWLASLGFFVIPGFFLLLKQIKLSQVFTLLGIGVLVALHWITFYGSIKIGKSASLTLGCFGLTSTFTSILEPLIYRKKFVKLDMLMGLFALIGITIIAFYLPETNKDAGNAPLAIVVGIFSTFLAALFSTINSTITNKIDTKVITFFELSGGFLFLCLVLLFKIGIQDVLSTEHFALVPWVTQTQNTQGVLSYLAEYSDIVLILLLALVCTNVAFVMNLNAMKKVSAFTANLAINLEPVYGIILAAVILKEHEYLNTQFYIGASIILFSVILHSILKYRANKYQSNH
jgi:drug/metabolite transporter (DMT)-like permease